jgi:hypothetical protein
MSGSNYDGTIARTVYEAVDTRVLNTFDYRTDPQRPDRCAVLPAQQIADR